MLSAPAPLSESPGIRAPNSPTLTPQPTPFPGNPSVQALLLTCLMMLSMRLTRSGLVLAMNLSSPGGLWGVRAGPLPENPDIWDPQHPSPENPGAGPPLTQHCVVQADVGDGFEMQDAEIPLWGRRVTGQEGNSLGGGGVQWPLPLTRVFVGGGASGLPPPPAPGCPEASWDPRHLGIPPATPWSQRCQSLRHPSSQKAGCGGAGSLGGGRRSRIRTLPHPPGNPGI